MLAAKGANIARWLTTGDLSCFFVVLTHKGSVVSALVFGLQLTTPFPVNFLLVIIAPGPRKINGAASAFINYLGTSIPLYKQCPPLRRNDQVTFTHPPSAMDCSIYRAPGPYPRPQCTQRNIRYARILQCAYSASVSELTAIHQYVYHHIITQQELPELSAALQGIAIVEMHHLQLLGECILHLGLHPTFSYYQGTRRARWNSGFVQYARGAKAIVGLSIHSERQAIELYEQATARISDELVNALLARIIEDERVHIDVLRGLTDAD